MKSARGLYMFIFMYRGWLVTCYTFEAAPTNLLSCLQAVNVPQSLLGWPRCPAQAASSPFFCDAVSSHELVLLGRSIRIYTYFEGLQLNSKRVSELFTGTCRNRESDILRQRKSFSWKRYLIILVYDNELCFDNVLFHWVNWKFHLHTIVTIRTEHIRS